MSLTLCPACQLPLEYTREMAGEEMGCPRCAARFVVPSSGYSEPPPPPAFQPESIAPATFERHLPLRRPFHDQATSLLDLFDLSFTRYVTPLIVKITWVLALALAA